MSRDELPQYITNMTLTSFGTPSCSFQPLWTTPNANPSTPIVMGTGFQTYSAYLATPVLRTSIKRSHENSGQSAPKKPRKIFSLTEPRRALYPEQPELLRACKYRPISQIL